MPKIYVKTIVLSFLLGLILTYAILNNLLSNKLVIWICLILITAILINEKLTRREKWKLEHYALLTISAITYIYILSLI